MRRLDPRMVAVALAGFCAFINLYSSQALLPLLAAEFAASPAAVSLTVSVPTFAVAFMAPIVGVVADLLGRKRVIAAACIAIAVPTFLAGLSGSLGELIFWRLLQGLLVPPIIAVIVAYIGDELPPAQATTMTGVWVASTGVAGFLGRFITGIAADHLGWRSAFMVLGGLTLVAAAGVALLLPREQGFVRGAGLSASLNEMARHLANRELLATYAVGFGILFSFVAVFTYVNFPLAAPPFDFSPSALGSIFLVYLMGSAVAPMTGRWTRRLGRRHLVVVATVTWLAGLALLLSGSLLGIIAGLVIAAASGFVCQATSTSHVAVTAQHARSSAAGLYVMIYYLGGSAGGTIPGFFWTHWGWPGVVASVAAVIAAMGAIVLAFWRGQPQDR